eukprot:TRINITY_DN12502_c0_g1_i4.p3 TRINITY_DN12502_c0_g1~~TRINITY_DN12502_c0_g1_i4.p3  ORF type:complete len:100 (+),score=19.14 TRINITY_DN12502_c0_g1_i4:305-604(+)
MLPKGRYELRKTQRNCSICLLFFQKDEQLTYLPCDPRHHFHTRCIETWLEQDSKCPICKTLITTRDVKQCKSLEEMTAFVREKDNEEYQSAVSQRNNIN